MKEDRLPTEIRRRVLERARKMRKKPTEAEKILWDAIRKEQLNGIKFRRQHLIGAYIIDFYCPKAKLVIEVDGPVHKDQKEYDHHRENYLIAKGYRVLRFRNETILDDLESALKLIQSAIEK